MTKDIIRSIFDSMDTTGVHMIVLILEVSYDFGVSLHIGHADIGFKISPDSSEDSVRVAIEENLSQLRAWLPE